MRNSALRPVRAPSIPAGGLVWLEAAGGGATAAFLAGAGVSLVSASGAERSAAALLWLGVLPIQIVGFAAAAWVVVCRGRPGEWVEVWGLRLHAGSWRRELGRSLVTVLWLYPAVAAATALSAILLRSIGFASLGSPLVALSARADGSPAFWLSIVFTSVVLAPVAEEVLFRLVCMQACRILAIPRPAWVTALLFAGIHRAPEQFPGLLLLGLVLQAARERSGSLIPPILIHSGFNTFGVVLLACIPRIGAAG